AIFSVACGCKAEAPPHSPIALHPHYIIDHATDDRKNSGKGFNLNLSHYAAILIFSQYESKLYV
ncbi:MAG: hypothetical protein ACI9BC_002785, partial [Crocinitomicaceae bacterium]